MVLSIGPCNDADINATSDDDEAYKLLHAADIKDLCDRDVTALVMEMERTKVAAHHSISTVLPTHDLVRWQHARAEFIGLKKLRKSPQCK
jgi:hypothetical protein